MDTLDNVAPARRYSDRNANLSLKFDNLPWSAEPCGSDDHKLIIPSARYPNQFYLYLPILQIDAHQIEKTLYLDSHIDV